MPCINDLIFSHLCLHFMTLGYLLYTVKMNDNYFVMNIHKSKNKLEKFILLFIKCHLVIINISS